MNSSSEVSQEKINELQLMILHLATAVERKADHTELLSKLADCLDVCQSLRQEKSVMQEARRG